MVTEVMVNYSSSTLSTSGKEEANDYSPFCAPRALLISVCIMGEGSMANKDRCLRTSCIMHLLLMVNSI